MGGTRLTQGVLSGLLFTAALLADDPPATPSAPASPTKPATAQNQRAMRLHLMEGSVVTGRLSIESIMVETDFGKLEIPVSSILSLTPGLDSHPEVRKKIHRLIQELGSNAAEERERAQRQLIDMGAAVQAELARFTNDEDTERRTRVQKILAELEEVEQDADADPISSHTWIAQDTVETNQFTVVGKVSPQTFIVQTPFGPLNVAISDIRRGERESDQKPEIRKSLAVKGDHLVQLAMLNSGVRVNRGDKVVVSAEGRLTMSPWGGGVTSGPEGSEQFQWFIPNQIPGGALVARIGDGGKIFKVGAKATFTAQRAGTLQFGIAMNPQFASADYNFPGEYNVKVRVNPR